MSAWADAFLGNEMKLRVSATSGFSDIGHADNSGDFERGEGSCPNGGQIGERS